MKTTDAERDRRRRDERLHDAQRQVLQLVDVVDERAEDRPAPVRASPSGASGISRRTSAERVVASCRSAASWPASRSR